MPRRSDLRTQDWLLPPRLARRWTDADGTFAIADLPRRRVRLFVEADRLAPRAVELDTSAGNAVRIELQQARKVTATPPPGVGGMQFRVLDVAGRPLVDDRLRGSIRYGAALTVGAEAATIEAFDATTGAKIGSGLVPYRVPPRVSTFSTVHCWSSTVELVR